MVISFSPSSPQHPLPLPSTHSLLTKTIHSSPCSHYFSSRVRWKITREYGHAISIYTIRLKRHNVRIARLLVENYGFSYLYKIIIVPTRVVSFNECGWPCSGVPFNLQIMASYFISNPEKKKKKKKNHKANNTRVHHDVDATKEIRNQYPKNVANGIHFLSYIYIRIYFWARKLVFMCVHAIITTSQVRHHIDRQRKNEREGEEEKRAGEKEVLRDVDTGWSEYLNIVSFLVILKFTHL